MLSSFNEQITRCRLFYLHILCSLETNNRKIKNVAHYGIFMPIFGFQSETEQYSAIRDLLIEQKKNEEEETREKKLVILSISFFVSEQMK